MSGERTDTGRRPGRHCGILSRIRHLRGHGIHSPFVYRLVRTVFSGRGWLGDERNVYDMLRKNGMGSRAARQLQNFSIACGFIWTGAGLRTDGGMCVIMPGDRASVDMIMKNTDTTFVVVSPYRGRGRIDACLDVAATGARLTIDTRRFFIIFSDRQQPKQHFKI